MGHGKRFQITDYGYLNGSESPQPHRERSDQVLLSRGLVNVADVKLPGRVDARIGVGEVEHGVMIVEEVELDAADLRVARELLLDRVALAERHRDELCSAESATDSLQAFRVNTHLTDDSRLGADPVEPRLRTRNDVVLQRGVNRRGVAVARKASEGVDSCEATHR